MGLSPVADDQLATVVTSLEMRERPRPRPLPQSSLRMVPWTQPTPAAYRALFRRVGEPWLWFSRLVMDDAQLNSIIHDPNVAIWAVVDRQGVEVGILELDFRHAGEAEIAYFGLVPELAGQGQGRWLMTHCLMQAWRSDINRVWVHTCTLDHPSALNFYRRSGFTPFARAVETFADPRAIGLIDPGSAPHIPLLVQSLIK
jgi:GNAT superfamily N-acetyltransferase